MLRNFDQPLAKKKTWELAGLIEFLCSALDLEYTAKVKAGKLKWRDEYSEDPSVYKGTNGGFAVQIGAATDDQYASDGYADVAQGAATHSFVQVGSIPLADFPAAKAKLA